MPRRTQIFKSFRTDKLCQDWEWLMESLPSTSKKRNIILLSIWFWTLVSPYMVYSVSIFVWYFWVSTFETKGFVLFVLSSSFPNNVWAFATISVWLWQRWIYLIEKSKNIIFQKHVSRKTRFLHCRIRKEFWCLEWSLFCDFQDDLHVLQRSTTTTNRKGCRNFRF